MSDLLLLTGEQIVLRDWKLGDVGPWTRWMAPGHAWQEFDGPYFPPPTTETIATSLERLEDGIRTADWPTPRANLPICLRDSDRMIGRVSWYWRERETDWRSLGIDVYDPACWRRGIGHEALGLWTDYLFDVAPELRRLDLATWSGNTAMIRLAEKLGFVEEARFRKARVVKGEEHDSLGFGVLREEWKARYPNGFGAQFR